MKRNALVLIALAGTVFALASLVPVGPQPVTGLTAEGDTTVVVRRMYEGVGVDMYGTGVSPDGRYLTQNMALRTGDLVVIDFLTGEKTTLDSGGEGWVSGTYSQQSKFSPDGKKIASVWSAPGGPEIRVVDVDGSNERVVMSGVRRVWPEVHGWSPDGTQLLVTSYQLDQGEGDLILVNIEDGATRVLREGWADAAVFSPDGRYVGFDRNDGLYLIPVNGGREVKLTSGSAHYEFLGFSPSGGEVLFHSDRDFTEGVWLLPIQDGQAAGEPRLVKGGLRRFQRIGVSGGRLFYGILTQNRALYTAPIDLTRGFLSGPPLRIQDGPEARVGAGAWSQDGRMLAYPRESLGGIELVIRSVDGEQAQEIQTALRRPGPIWWGANGDRLIVSDRDPNDRDWQGLLQVDVRTGETSRYLNSEGAGGLLTRDRQVAYYGRDGRGRVVRSSGGERRYLNRHDLNTGAVEEIVRLDTLIAMFNMRFNAFSPDEQWLAFQSWNAAPREWTIGAVSTVTGELRKLAKHPTQESDPNDPNDPDVVCRMTTWTADGQSIVYARAVTGQRDCTVYRVPFAGGETEAIGRMPSNRGVAITPDRSRISFLHGDVRGEIWMMDHIPWSDR